jgi:signal transduction histidine kinase
MMIVTVKGDRLAKLIQQRLRWIITPLQRLNISTKLGIAFVGFAALPVIVMGWIAWTMTAQTMQNSAIKEMSHRSEAIKIRIQDFAQIVSLDMQFLKATRIAREQISNTNGISKVQSFWAQSAMELLRTRPQYARLTYLPYQGQEPTLHLQRNPYNRQVVASRVCRYSWNYYQIIIDNSPSGSLHLTPVELVDPETGRTFAAFSAALADRDSDGNLRGIIIADIFAEVIFSLIEATLVDLPQYTAGLTNEDGQYLYHSEWKQDWNRLLADTELRGLQPSTDIESVRQILSTEDGAFMTPEGNVVYHLPMEMGSLGFNRAYYFYVSQPKALIFAPLRTFGQIFLILTALFIGTALILSRMATRQLVRPIIRLQEGANIIAEGDFTHRLAIHTGDEIEDLAEQFNRMASFIEERDHQLNVYSSDLERLVATRTEQLREEQQQVLQSEKLAALGEMAAVIAHEIRNSLTSSNMLLQLIHESDSLDTDARQSLEVVLSSTMRVDKIVTELLSFARPAPVKMEAQDIVPLLRESINLYRPHFEQHHIQTELNVADNMPYLMLDQNLMREVFANILLNAAQAISDGGTIQIDTQVIHPNGHPADSHQGNGNTGSRAVDIVIKDTGPGIAEGDLKRIFDPFHTTKPTGTGLGLSMAKRVIEAHRGHIYAENGSDGGAAIHITIPIQGE